ncbi:MAG: glyceraldehyde-3-phosphate dehydrogenase [Magnetococcales bacterium]|nr:glyceraldehyde-3-phosphate dehydrogenase [Magnetococcales bacterium]
MKLGINSMGRIGKLTLWHHLARRHFSELVVNVGRPVGTGLPDLVDALCKDTTYGQLGRFLHGHKGGLTIEELNEESGRVIIDGMPIHFLRSERNPSRIGWRSHDVRLVVDCTGVFVDPVVAADAPAGSLRGHLEAGAEKVLLSAPFKIKDKGMGMPADAITAIMGINEEACHPGQHHLISAASCTTTCLAFMMKPLLDHFGADNILSASMVTVHAATSSQPVLDSVPTAGSRDLRKNRSIFNNIILTTTGAAKALSLVIPEMRHIGFMAESVRIPVSTGSLIILTVNVQSEDAANPINRSQINAIFQQAAEGVYRDRLLYSTSQNVSSDIIGTPKAAVVMESQETHTRTAFSKVHLDRLATIPPEVRQHLTQPTLEVPVTQVVLYGWYDNELGSYTNALGDLTVHIAEEMI